MDYVALGFAANVDNVVVGAAGFGLRSRPLSAQANAIIAVCNVAATVLAVLAGEQLRALVSPMQGDVAGGLVFVLLGCCALRDAAAAADHDSGQSSESSAHAVEWRQALVIGVSLSFSNLAGGVAAGLAGFDVVALSATMFIASWLGIRAGEALGEAVGRRLTPRVSAVLAAAALLLVGVWRCVWATL